MSTEVTTVKLPNMEDFQKMMKGEWEAGTMKNGQKIDPRNLIFQNRVKDESECSLWNDSRWKTARDNMSEDQYQQYQTIGNQFHGSINYTDGTNTGVPIPEPARDSVAHIIMGLKSGLLPSDLTNEEKDVMEVFQGKEWYKNYGFDSINNTETNISSKNKIDTQNQ
jgi:hypothetical protein